MSPYTDTYGQAGDWLIGTAKRNPEALLVLAAGCALLLRNAGSSPARASSKWQYDEYYGERRERPEPERSWREDLSRTAETAKDYASDVTERVSDTASSYASAASRYAEEGRRTMSAQASRFKNQAQSTAGQLWREQPLAVALFGLAAGAALAALLPSTEVEEQALGQARDAVGDAAGRAGENLKAAVSEAGERLKQSAAERGLSPEGLKEMARDTAQTFTSKASGESSDTSSPSMVPNNPEPVGGGTR
jgi:hypothetical protein